ncbi:hypothetical protein Pan241w_49970 [Gimesia alba]|uniref:Uncharacterized protein n=1 Tax=Gimesia alba TaxID=2527973 RepID=A0A517RLW8_9PLAN|nr:hypothetical protein Pan241w_49970 [Gimesia alba]
MEIKNKIASLLIAIVENYRDPVYCVNALYEAANDKNSYEIRDYATRYIAHRNILNSTN